MAFTSRETMSTPDEWVRFYQTDNYFSDIDPILPPPPAAVEDSRNTSLTPNHGRITKPLRRRTRSSRRTPTTHFNTDAANFRSMVQQYTGAPTISPFAATSRPPGGGGTFVHDAILDEAVSAINNAQEPTAGYGVQYYSHSLPQHLQVVAINRSGGGGGEVAPSHAPPGFSSSMDHRDYHNYME